MVKEHIHITSNKYNKKIAMFADIHFSKGYPKQIFSKIIENIRKNKPDYICIPGDIIDDATVLKNEKLVDKLYQFLKTLSTAAPVILSYGNHDESIIKNHKGIYCNTTKFFNKLNDLENIYFLDNTNIQFDNINFIGYHPDYSYFKLKEKKQPKDIKKIDKCVINDYCNILLCHSPIYILNYKLPINYILSGHMHNGLIPSQLNKYGNNKGLVGPYGTFFPKLSRGMVTKNDIKLIINGGVRKISNSSSLILRVLNLIYHIDIDYIEI